MTPRERIHREIAEIAVKNGCTLEDIMRHVRIIRIVKVRDEAIYTIWMKYGFPLSRIGNIFNRCHSTIITSLGRHMKRIGVDHEYVDALRKKRKNQKKINQRAQVLNDAA